MLGRAEKEGRDRGIHEEAEESVKRLEKMEEGEEGRRRPKKDGGG